MSAGPPTPQNPPAEHVKAVNCPKCGAAIALRSFGKAESVVCINCHSILDATDPTLKVLQTFRAIVEEVPPLIPLGKRGKIRGEEYEVIGFQRRSTLVEGVRYAWHEYVLFNPYKGFRYLTEYNGHWNDVGPCKMLPTVLPGDPPSAKYLGESYKHFQTCTANTDYVVGEFPWQVRVGEKALVTDLVSPPRVLSSEKSGDELTWSIGEYMYGRDVWAAFQLPGSPPVAVGVFENQPAPVHESVKAVWATFAVLCFALLVLLIAFAGFISKGQQVFAATYSLARGEPKGEASFITDPFDLGGRTSNVEVITTADVDNAWIYLNYALLNQDTGEAWDFGREVSYYHGRDSDGNWSEGSQDDSVVLPYVPAGKYYLRIEPELDANHPAITYTVQVKRDVPLLTIFAMAFVALLLPAIALSWRTMNFERTRWAESDHPILKIGSSEDD